MGIATKRNRGHGEKQMKKGPHNMTTTKSGGSNPPAATLDIFKAFYRFRHSTPAKPLHCMLNSGGFFFFGGCSS
jgi:hypothetical protein